jgi:DNA-binding response OmpR family regulator
MVAEEVVQEDGVPGERVLVVDDESTVREVVQRYLERDGFVVACVGNGRKALDVIATWLPDLVVLDLQLPGLDGLEVCRAIRAQGTTPVIMLTARASELDRIAGLELGADDYVVKPFSPRELLARVRSVLRRTQWVPGPPGSATIHVGDLTIDPLTRSVEVAGRSVRLSVREFDLLIFLARHPLQVFTRTQLLKEVWSYTWVGETSTLTVHMRRLREKVEADPSNPVRLQTAYGVGYRLVPIDQEVGSA